MTCALVTLAWVVAASSSQPDGPPSRTTDAAVIRYAIRASPYSEAHRLPENEIERRIELLTDRQLRTLAREQQTIGFLQDPMRIILWGAVVLMLVVAILVAWAD